MIIISTGYLGYKYFKNQPKKITSYQGIALGDSKDEVYYSLGIPSSVLFPIEFKEFSEGKGEKNAIQRFADADEIKSNPRGKKGFNDWQYIKGSGIPRVDVTFDSKNERVIEIGCFVELIDLIYPESKSYNVNPCLINGVRAGDKEDEIIGILGVPKSSSISEMTKTINYPNLNLQIRLVRKTAYYIIVKSNFR